MTERSCLLVYRCLLCDGIYNLYSGTRFQGSHLRPSQVVMLLRGVCQGKPSAKIAREIEVGRHTVMALRHALQQHAEQMRPETPLPDHVTETDEMFQNAGEKGIPHRDPSDPPRQRGNKRRGHGTYDNDRPPIVGTVGRETTQVRLRVVHHTDQATLTPHVHRLTRPDAVSNTDEWKGYDPVERLHPTVCHSRKEWARDDDGDGIREVHINTTEGMWTTVRNFLRPFRGVSQRFLAGYVAIVEFAINLKTITPDFIGQLVACTTS